jgi:hypothetical protein
VLFERVTPLGFLSSFTLGAQSRVHLLDCIAHGSSPMVFRSLQ